MDGAHRGALNDLIEDHLTWPLSNYSGADGDRANQIHQLITYFFTGRVLAAIPIAIAGAAWIWRTDRRDAVVILVWLAVAPFNVLLQGKFVEYHWHPLFPPLAVLCGVGLWGLQQMYNDARGDDRAVLERVSSFSRALVVALGTLVFSAALVEPVLHDYRWSTYEVGLRSEASLQSVAFGEFGRGIESIPSISAYIAARTRPTDAVLAWGLLPLINFQSQRRSPTRFGYVSPLVYAHDSEFRRRYRREFLAGINADQPAYVMALDTTLCAMDPNRVFRVAIPHFAGTVECLEALPGLRAFVLAHYSLETRMGSYYDIWRRIPQPVTRPLGAVSELLPLPPQRKH